MIKIPPDFVVQDASCNNALSSLLELPIPYDDRYDFLYNISDTNAAGHEEIEKVVSCTSSSSSSGEDSDYFVDEDASSNEASESESAQKSQRSS